MLQELMGMGFNEGHATAALEKTGGRDIAAAIEWMVDNPQQTSGKVLGSDSKEGNSDAGKESNIMQVDDQKKLVEEKNELKELVVHNAVCDKCKEQIVE